MNSLFSSCIVLTFEDEKGVVKLPHLESLKLSNPKLKIFICNNGKSLSGSEKTYKWRNCDNALRSFWKENSDKIQGENIAVLEWDVLVTQELPPFLGKVGFANIETKPNWHWMSESPKLKNIKPVGVVPFGVGFWSREALDFICSPRWDCLYKQDIFCELRTGSILASKFKIEKVNLPNVSWKEVLTSGVPSIYHSVKI